MGEGTRSLEPLQIMKGMFLATMRGPADAVEGYTFRPYDYGPFTPEVYRDLDELAGAGLIAQEAVPGRSWRTYRPTELGFARAAEALIEAPKPLVQALDDAYQFVSRRGFLRLLRDIYAAYPDYAVNTVVKDASPTH